MDITKKRALWGAAVLTVAVACGGDDMAGELLRDAGEILVDAGQALTDAGGAARMDAQAQATQPKSETYEVACTDALVRTEKTDGVTVRLIRRVADVSTNTGDITGIDVIVCGREGADYVESCTEADMCSGSSQLVRGECHPSNAAMESGKVRADCGSFREVNGVAPSGPARWKRARITIRR